MKITSVLFIIEYWMVFYAPFNSILVISRRQFTWFMSFLRVSPVLGWGSEVSCPRTLPQKKHAGSSAARTQDPGITSQTLHRRATQDPTGVLWWLYQRRLLKTLQWKGEIVFCLFLYKCYYRCIYVISNRQRNSHLILIGAAKLSFEDAKLCWRGCGSRKILKKWCEFVHSRVSFSTNFVSFLRHFLSILFSDFIGAECCTNRKYWCGKCRTCRNPVYIHDR